MYFCGRRQSQKISKCSFPISQNSNDKRTVWTKATDARRVYVLNFGRGLITMYFQSQNPVNSLNKSKWSDLKNSSAIRSRGPWGNGYRRRECTTSAAAVGAEKLPRYSNDPNSKLLFLTFKDQISNTGIGPIIVLMEMQNGRL